MCGPDGTGFGEAELPGALTTCMRSLTRADDPQFADFVETMMEEQVCVHGPLNDLLNTRSKHDLTHMLVVQASGVKQVSDYVAQLRRIGKGYGVYEFDKDIGQVAASMGQTPAHASIPSG